MSRSYKTRGLRRISDLQEQVRKIKKSGDDPHARSEIRKVKSKAESMAHDLEQLQYRIEDLEAAVEELQEREENDRNSNTGE